MPEAITPSAAQSLGCSVEITKLNPAHSRRCAICRHPDRLFIELEFLEWGHPALIAHEYNLSDRHTVYRHAHAAGLFVRRRRNLVCICEGILEKAERKQITSRDLTFAFNYIERSVRSELAGSATELDRTVTRSADRPLPQPTVAEDPAPAAPEQATGNPDSEPASRLDTPADPADSKGQELSESRQNGENNGPSDTPKTRTAEAFARLRKTVTNEIAKQHALQRLGPH